MAAILLHNHLEEMPSIWNPKWSPKIEDHPTAEEEAAVIEAIEQYKKEFYSLLPTIFGDPKIQTPSPGGDKEWDLPTKSIQKHVAGTVYTQEGVLVTLKAAGVPLTKGEILRKHPELEPVWIQTIKSLLVEGKVIQTGIKRGTRYSVVSPSEGLGLFVPTEVINGIS